MPPKRKKRSKHTHTPQKPPIDPQKANRIKAVAFYLLVAVLAGLPFALGKYIEFNSPGPYDSGAYVYSAWHILKGAVIGVDEVPSAALGTLLVNMLGVKLFGFGETGPIFIQMIMQAAALVLMFFAMKKLFGKLPAAIGVILASFYLSAPVIAKFGNVKEQYMIACMILGVSSLVLYQTSRKWPWALLAGAFVSWAPLFKPTGISAIVAIGLFVVLQPIFKNRTWKKTSHDILLIFAGAALALAPLYIWTIGWNVKIGKPYQFAWTIVKKKLTPPKPEVIVTPDGKETKKKSYSYIESSRKAIPFKDYSDRIGRYYMLLILPIALAVISILARWTRLLFRFKLKDKIPPKHYDRFVLLFGIWWAMDMALVWVSPRSYEQYYLPLNASAAMLSGYIVALYSDKLRITKNKPAWISAGLVALICMVAMGWHIYFGITQSPHSGSEYINEETQKIQHRRGYKQRLDDIRQRKETGAKGYWEHTAQYIKNHSAENDKIYVWGWEPGTYVYAQRLAATKRAFTSEMHMMPPEKLEKYVRDRLDDFKKQLPEFIVDTQKRHAPWDRPPLALWPTFGKNNAFLPNNETTIAQYETAYAEVLKNQVNSEEAQRFKAMKPLRDFVMTNYKVVQRSGPNIIFQLKQNQN